ncbi:MAG: TonB-dependent receptor [Sulfurimonas sp. RIFOXYD12_FULL_33_39]|nr:MAG: TonB-dependent receptor [Sulfurimonas sp. RIFOXYD12_FULL_33_39]OHE13048.1 MAG: TonB-dependent receptor [Sulfurimonas sp. RIFOXYD2_FULL_34_21]
MELFGDIATKTKLNEHYQPYIISIFQGKELEKLGVSTLKEALTLVPGADTATDNFNNQVPIFRGSNPLAYGQSKLFIDGVSVNNLFFEGYSEYLSLPIEMIKRIEVVRGPGSKTNKVNSYAGSINVITYAEDMNSDEKNDKIIFKAGSYNYKMGGFTKTYKKDDFSLFSDFFYQQDDKKLSSGYDALSQGLFSFSSPFVIDNRPLSSSADAPLWLKNYSLGMTLKYKEFSLKARTLNHKQGAGYGYLYMLPQENDYLKSPSHYLELAYDKKIDDYDINIAAGAKYDTFDYNAKVAPDNFKTPTAIFSDGMYGEYYAKQRTLYQAASLKYSGFENHTISIGYRLTNEETIDMFYKLSNLTTGNAALVDYTQTRPFFDKDAKRNTYTFTIEDEYSYSDYLVFTYGFNYEKTSLQNSNFDPRISAVYQYDVQNIFKAIYSKLDRNPSWQEMFIINNHAISTNKNLKPEHVNAYEAAYIRKFSSDAHLQVNLFFLNNSKQIHNTTAHPDYENIKDIDIYGTELEYKGNVTHNDQLYLNYSFVDGKDNDNVELAIAAQHMAKGYYIYNIKNNISISTILKYVGSKEREQKDTREKLSDYYTVDASLYYKNKINDYSLTLSVKNIFDQKVKHPSASDTYPDDYTQEQRSFMVTYVKRF